MVKQGKAQPKIYYSDAQKAKDTKSNGAAAGKPKVVKAAKVVKIQKASLGKSKIVLGKKVNKPDVKKVPIVRRAIVQPGAASRRPTTPQGQPLKGKKEAGGSANGGNSNNRIKKGQKGGPSTMDIVLVNAKSLASMKYHPNKDAIRELVAGFEKGWIAEKKFDQELRRLSPIAPTR
jgi:hypothetical protein